MDVEIPAIIQIVIEHIIEIIGCKDKDIVVFIGREQVGKSTTINCLLGTKFIKQKRVVKAANGSTIHAPMGSLENAGLMCTVFPAVYKDPIYNTYYLDTQGFFGTDKDPNEIAAASILLDAAIKSAASVKMVYLEDFGHFSRGLTDINDAIDLFSKVIMDNNSPVYCLFNRYHPDDPEYFYSLGNELDKENYIKNELKEIAERLVKSVDKNILNLTQKIKKVYDKSLTSSTRFLIESTEIVNQVDEIKKTINKSKQSAYVIDKNFKEGRFGYIDPLSENNINKLHQALEKLPTIDKKKFSFNCCNSQRNNFSRKFEKIIQRNICPSINDFIFCLHYPPNIISSVIAHQNDEYKKNQNLLERVNNGIKVDMSDALNNLLENKEQVNNEINELKRKIREKEIIINRNIKEKPIKYCDIPFNEPVEIIKFWRNKTIKYDEDIAFIGIDEILGEGTIRNEIINFEKNKFNEIKIDDHRVFFDLIDKNNPVKNFEVSYTSGDTSKKIKTAIGLTTSAVVGGVLGFIGLPSLCIPLGYLASSFIGKCYPCAGVISFYVRYQDKEKETIIILKKEIRQLKQQIKERKDDLQDLEKNISEQKDIIQLNNHYIHILLVHLNLILEFVNEKTEIWNMQYENNKIFKTIKDEYKAYYQVSRMLYNENDRNETINNFLNLYNKLTTISPDSGKVTPNKIINSYRRRNII